MQIGCIGSLLNSILALLNVRFFSNPPFAFWLWLPITLDSQILVVNTKTCMQVVVLSIGKVNCTLPYTMEVGLKTRAMYYVSDTILVWFLREWVRILVTS